MSRRITATLTCLVVTLALAPAALGPFRGAPNPIPAASLTVGRTQEASEPDRSVFRGASGPSALPPPPLGASPSPSVTRVDAAGTQPAGTARPQAPTPSVSRPVAASPAKSAAVSSSLALRTPPPTLPLTDPPQKRPLVAQKRPVAPRTPLRTAIRSSGGSGRALTGTASWFCLPGRSACTAGFPASGAYAAAGPRLRSALGPGWRGREVRVTADGASVTVTLSDWCACTSGYLLDLYASVFGQLARGGLSQGVLDVTVTW